MNRAVFFDVDGVIRHNNTSKKDGCYYCLSYDQVDYINGIFKAHKFLQDAGYKIFWVTSQGCVTEGLITENDVHEILMRMCKDFERNDIHIDDYQICYPSVTSKIESEMSESKVKVKVDAVNKLAMVYNIDLSRSIGIGDRKSDIDSYKQSGIPITIHAINMFGDEKYMDADYHYTQNPNISNTESLYELLMRIHGCNDIPHLIRIAEIFHYVKKVWGGEYHIANSILGNYCSKILVLKPDHISSLHYHKVKCETFTVLAGIVRITNADEGGTRVMIKRENTHIPPEIYHRFEAVNSPAVILETSTYHDDDDTYRLEESK